MTSPQNPDPYTRLPQFRLNDESRDNRGCMMGIGTSFIGVIAVIVAVVLIVSALVSMNATHWRETTICDKERVAVEGGGEYRIYTDTGTFVMKDALLNMRFDTADAYGKLKVGVRYNIKYKGWRFGPTSNFPNILDFEKLPESKQAAGNCE